jgi:hypothetical protein
MVSPQDIKSGIGIAAFGALVAPFAFLGRSVDSLNAGESLGKTRVGRLMISYKEDVICLPNC